MFEILYSLAVFIYFAKKQVVYPNHVTEETWVKRSLQDVGNI